MHASRINGPLSWRSSAIRGPGPHTLPTWCNVVIETKREMKQIKEKRVLLGKDFIDSATFVLFDQDLDKYIRENNIRDSMTEKTTQVIIFFLFSWSFDIKGLGISLELYS